MGPSYSSIPFSPLILHKQPEENVQHFFIKLKVRFKKSLDGATHSSITFSPPILHKQPEENVSCPLCSPLIHSRLLF